MTPNASPMHTAQNTQSNQSNNSHHIPNRPPPPRPTPANSNPGNESHEFKWISFLFCFAQFSLINSLSFLQQIEMFHRLGQQARQPLQRVIHSSRMYRNKFHVIRSIQLVRLEVCFHFHRLKVAQAVYSKI